MATGGDLGRPIGPREVVVIAHQVQPSRHGLAQALAFLQPLGQRSGLGGGVKPQLNYHQGRWRHKALANITLSEPLGRGRVDRWRGR